MKLKVFYKDMGRNIHLFNYYDIVVPFSSDHFDIISSAEEADIIPFNLISEKMNIDFLTFLNQSNLTNKVFVLMDSIYHIGERLTSSGIHENEDYFKNLVNKHLPKFNRPRNIIVLHTYSSISSDNKNIQYTDFLWNRHITFYVDQPDSIFAVGDQTKGHWYPYGSVDDGHNLNKKIYELSPLSAENHQEFLKHNSNCSGLDIMYPLKSYVSCSNIRNAQLICAEYTGFERSINSREPRIQTRDYLRSWLCDLLEKYPGHLGNISKHSYLIGQHLTENNIHNSISGTHHFGWIPAHNAYYETSVVSIYVETLTYFYSESEYNTSITEKTWEPLIKGHFILPFGYRGMIQELRENYGVRFPDWIYYDYDSITNDLKRWVCYINEVKRVLNLGAEVLHRLKIQDMATLQYNRDLFFNKRYKHTVYDALVNANAIPENIVNSSEPVIENSNAVPDPIAPSFLDRLKSKNV